MNIFNPAKAETKEVKTEGDQRSEAEFLQDINRKLKSISAPSPLNLVIEAIDLRILNKTAKK